MQIGNICNLESDAMRVLMFWEVQKAALICIMRESRMPGFFTRININDTSHIDKEKLEAFFIKFRVFSLSKDLQRWKKNNRQTTTYIIKSTLQTLIHTDYNKVCSFALAIITAQLTITTSCVGKLPFCGTPTCDVKCQQRYHKARQIGQEMCSIRC